MQQYDSDGHVSTSVRTIVLLITASLLLPALWIGTLVVLVMSGIILVLPALDVDQMPEAIYQEYLRSTQLSSTATTVWLIAGIPVALSSVTLFVMAIRRIIRRRHR